MGLSQPVTPNNLLLETQTEPRPTRGCQGGSREFPPNLTDCDDTHKTIISNMNIATTTEKTKQENENKIIKAWLAPGSNNTQQLVDQLENNSQSDLRREDRASTVTVFQFSRKRSIGVPVDVPM